MWKGEVTLGVTVARDARRLFAINKLSRRVHFVINFFWSDSAMTAITLNYSGHLHFRHRLVLAVLSGKAIKIDKIRPGDKNPGLRGMKYPDTASRG
jgi:hypothetical protein